MKKAQITVYLTLIFTLILSVLLSAFEAVRGTHLKLITENAVQTAIHSAFGEYHRELFDRYGLLFIDTSYMSQTPDYRNLEDRIHFYLEYNLQPEKEQHLLFSRDWYDIDEANVTLTNIRLATDDWGNVMKTQAVEYIKQYVGGDWIQEVQSWITISEDYDICEETFQQYHEEAVTQKDDAWKENNLLGKEWQVSYGLPTLEFDDTYLDYLGLNAIEEEFANVSVKYFDPTGHASYRMNIQGTDVLEEKGTDPLEELYFGEYILHKFGNYRDVHENSGLDYQVEYILFGYPQDTLNFITMADKLFKFRGAANIIMLLADEDTQEVIRLISQLGAFVDIPPQVVQIIINVCWGAAEAAVDTKKLIEGEEVLLLKEPKDFAVSLNGLLGNLAGEQNSLGSSGMGLDIKLSYEDYLRIFLFNTLPVLKVYRCMDMMEADIRLTKGNENFRMDVCADAVSMDFGITNTYGYFYSMERRYSYF